jgi:hypothetical protein
MTAEEARAMTDWDAITRELSPIPSFEDASRRLRGAFGYVFVQEAYDLAMPALADYTDRLLGGDTRQRYTGYAAGLIATFRRLGAAGVPGVRALVERMDTRAHFAALAQETHTAPGALAAALKFLIYWVVPMARPLRALARPGAEVQKVVEMIRETGLRTSLDLLEAGRAPAGRRALAARSGAPEALVDELVQRADFSRLPWTSAATISNYIGAGFATLSALAGAEPEQAAAQYHRYGASIGKNLKLGNEIENGHRIARLIPRVVA